MRLLAILLLPLALSGCSALSALSDATTVLDVYELQAPDAVPQGGARSLDVIVELPTTTGALDTDRVMVKPSQLQAQYLDDARYDPAVQLEDSDWEEDSTRRLQDALAGLDERSRHILQSRWLAENKATLHELADVYGVSAERIRQLEKNAMKKIRQQLGEAMVA